MLLRKGGQTLDFTETFSTIDQDHTSNFDARGCNFYRTGRLYNKAK